MVKSHATWSGEPTILADAITPFATSLVFVSYGEELSTPPQVNKMLPLRGMWRQVREKVCANLSFTQAVAQDALLIVYDRVKDQWPRHLTDAEVEDWKVMTWKRLRAQARAISQAEIKSPSTGWLLMLWTAPLDTPLERPKKKRTRLTMMLIAWRLQTR